MRRHRLAVLLLAAALAAPWTVTGCGGAVNEAAEKVIENETGGDVEIDDDKVTWTDEDGNSGSAGEGVEMPASWPGDVPVYDGGALQFATVSESEGSASVAWTSTQGAKAMYTEYTDQLEAAGFTAATEGSYEGTFSGTFTDASYAIAVAAASATGEENLLTVTVTPN